MAAKEDIERHVPQDAFAFIEGQTIIPPSPGLYTDEDVTIAMKTGLVLQRTHSEQIYTGVRISPNDLGDAMRTAVGDPNRKFLFGSYEAIEWLLRQYWMFRRLLP